MPKDTLSAAIKKGTGELQGELIEEIVYEGYGPWRRCDFGRKPLRQQKPNRFGLKKSF